jgi:PAS domain-containing protein
MAMNRYGVEARAYWQRWLPKRYAAIPDPTAFFTNLGEQVEQQVGDLWDQMVINDQPPTDETHEQRVGRLGMLKARAEYEVLGELVRLPPEPEAAAEAEADDGLLESDEQFAARMRRVREHTEWVSSTADSLIDGAITLDDLTNEQLRQVLDYVTPSFLRLFGTSVEDLRSRGRDV